MKVSAVLVFAVLALAASVADAGSLRQLQDVGNRMEKKEPTMPVRLVIAETMSALHPQHAARMEAHKMQTKMESQKSQAKMASAPVAAKWNAFKNPAPKLEAHKQVQAKMESHATAKMEGHKSTQTKMESHKMAQAKMESHATQAKMKSGRSTK